MVTNVKATQRTVPLDSSTSWVVAIGISIVLSCQIWFFRCSSILFVGVLEAFGGTREEASWPFTLNFVACCTMGPVAGQLSQRFEPRKILLFSTLTGTFAVVISTFSTNIWELTLTLGVLQGLSASIPVTLAGTIVTQYFDKRRSAAMGILMAGPAIVSIVFPSYIKLCLDAYGFRSSLLLLAGINMQAIPVTLMLRDIGSPQTQTGTENPSVTIPVVDRNIVTNPSGKPIPVVVLRQLGGNRVRRDTPRLSVDSTSANDATQPSAGDTTPTRSRLFLLFSNKWFYAMGLANIMFILNNATLLHLMEDFAKDKNVEPALARNLIGLFAGADLAARLSSGWITDKGFLSREMLLMVDYIIIACMLVLFVFSTTSIGLCVTVIVIGWCLGSAVILFTDILRERLGLQLLPLASGWYFFWGGIIGLSRPKAIGYFRDTAGSYDPILYILAAGMVIAVAIYLFFLLFEKQANQGKEHIDSETQDFVNSVEAARMRSSSFTPSISSM